MRAWTSFLVAVLIASPAIAEEEFAASFRLRGGYDSNPLLAPRGHGSPLAALDVAAAYGKDNGAWITGASAEASGVRYRETGFDPLQNYRLRLRFANKGQNDLSFDATTTLVHFSSYDTQSAGANQRVHLQWIGGAWRPFVAGDLKVASLNELNVLLGDFLPEPLRYLRGTITPGVAYVKDKAEIGVSLAVSKTKYESEFDLFGFRRDNDRVQPAIYAKFNGENFSFAGAVSYFRAASRDADFSDVKAILFEASVAASWDKWSGEAALARSAEDTSFPISPVTINTAAHAKLIREIGGKTAAGIFARMLSREYWDSPFYSRTRTAGIEVRRDFDNDISLAGEVGFSKSLLISGAEAEGVVATLALTRRFGPQPKK